MHLFDLATLSGTALQQASASTSLSTLLWSLTRAAAVTAYVVLALTTVLGLLRSLARVTAIRTRWLTLSLDDLHQFSALLTAGFVALHLGTLLVDTYMNFSIVNILIPLAQPYRPFATDLGVLALYALGLVLISSWLRSRLKYATWRALHYASFVAFLFVTAHGLLAGSDASQPWMSAIYVAATGSVLSLIAFHVGARLLRPQPPVAPQRLENQQSANRPPRWPASVR